MIDLSRPNPLGLNIISDIPAHITKGELARRVLPADLTFDYALPQDWLNQHEGEEYYTMMCQCVTAYPEGEIFGLVVNLITGHIYY